MIQAGITDIALIGFAGFEVSDWFLCSVELEIKVKCCRSWADACEPR